jgi:CRISPR-associated protein Cas6
MQVVEVQFSLYGDVIPADHGYFLYSSISEHIPDIHGDETIGIHAISGCFSGGRRLTLTENSCLSVRLPIEKLKCYIPLAGKRLRLGSDSVRVGIPSIRLLIPAPNLYSRLVVIKGYMEPDSFLDAVKRTLVNLNIEANSTLIHQPNVEKSYQDRKQRSRSPFLRRTLRVRDREIVGFAVKVRGLSREGSISLQEMGIGGRRRFGCGLLIPDQSNLKV